MLVGLWFCSYMIANGLITWLPTLLPAGIPVAAANQSRLRLYDERLRLSWPLCSAPSTSIRSAGSSGTAPAFFLAAVPTVVLAILGATSAQQVLIFATATYAIIQTVTFSLYLYSAELYPTRLRAVGAGLAALGCGSPPPSGPLIVGWVVANYSISYVFVVFGVVLSRRGIHLHSVRHRDQGTRSGGAVALKRWPHVASKAELHRICGVRT